MLYLYFVVVVAADEFFTKIYIETIENRGENCLTTETTITHTPSLENVIQQNAIFTHDVKWIQTLICC